MITRLLLIIAFLFATVVCVRADQVVASVQQSLKDQGFYYGKITGQKDADTTAAIRRYQIRNGLKITGEINAEIQKSLGVKGGTAQPSPTPAARSRSPQPQTDIDTETEASDLRDDQPINREQQIGPRTPGYAPRSAATPQYDVPPSQGFAPAAGSVFAGTPYQTAPADVQRQLLAAAQTRLARQGYYRGSIDGAYGPGTATAVRVFQARFGMQPSGQLDVQTLGALGLLPGQRAPGMAPRAPRVYQPRPIASPDRVYVPW